MAATSRLVPKFLESDPDTFLSPLERAANVRNWSDSEHMPLPQCVLTGEDQEAYRSLLVNESQTDSLVKAAVLKAPELVTEAFRRRLRRWEKVRKADTCDVSKGAGLILIAAVWLSK